MIIFGLESRLGQITAQVTQSVYDSPTGRILLIPQGYRLIRAIRDGAQDTINSTGQKIIERQLNIAPTLTIRPGFPVRVIITQDLIFEPQ